MRWCNDQKKMRMAAGKEQNSWVMGELGQEAFSGVECFNDDDNGSIGSVVVGDQLWWSYSNGRGCSIHC